MIELPEDELLNELDRIAQDYDPYEYGLPAYPECPALAPLREAVRSYGLSCARAAMERAAQIAESDEFYGTVVPVAIAYAIRAEMSKEPQ